MMSVAALQSIALRAQEMLYPFMGETLALVSESYSAILILDVKGRVVYTFRG